MRRKKEKSNEEISDCRFHFRDGDGVLRGAVADLRAEGARETGDESVALTGSASVGGFAASKVSRLTPLGKGRAWLGEEADRADGVDKKQGDGR